MRDVGQPELLIRSLWPFAIKDSHLSAYAIVAAVALAVLWPVNLVGSVDSVIFNYFNNAAEAHALVYVSHWVSLYPTAIGYMVRDLPLVVQGAVYFLVLVCIVIVLQQELQKILEFAYRRLDAVILSFVVLVSVRLLCVLNLSWSVWQAYLAAACYILRKNIAAENYSVIGTAALALACLSNPAAVTFIPILLFYAFRRRGTASAWLNAALAVVMSAFYILMFVHRPEGPWMPPPRNFSAISSACTAPPILPR